MKTEVSVEEARALRDRIGAILDIGCNFPSKEDYGLFKEYEKAEDRALLDLYSRARERYDFSAKMSLVPRIEALRAIIPQVHREGGEIAKMRLEKLDAAEEHLKNGEVEVAVLTMRAVHRGLAQKRAADRKKQKGG